MPAPAQKVLTEADIAAMAAGGIAPPAVALVTPTPSAAAAGDAPATPAAAAPAPVASAAAAAADTPAPAAAAAPAAAVPAPTDVTAFLQSQIATKDASLLAANVKIAGLEAQLADGKTAMDGLKAIAANAVSNMRVALGGAKTDLSALSATELLAQHAAAQTDFTSKFKVGGVAAVVTDQPANQAATSGVSQAEQDRLNRFVG